MQLSLRRVRVRGGSMGNGDAQTAVARSWLEVSQAVILNQYRAIERQVCVEGKRLALPSTLPEGWPAALLKLIRKCWCVRPRWVFCISYLLGQGLLSRKYARSWTKCRLWWTEMIPFDRCLRVYISTKVKTGIPTASERKSFQQSRIPHLNW